MSDTHGLEVTNVRFNKFESGAMKAWAAVEFNSTMTVEGFKVFGKEGRLWASPPSDKKDDQYFDRVKFPKDWGKDENPILSSIIEAYNAQNGKGATSAKKATTSPQSSAVEKGDEPW